MEEPSTGECRSCHGTYCARCLVYSFGPKKPPFCVGCALRASGVRSGARRNMQVQKLSVPTAEPTSFGSAPALFTEDASGGGPSAPRSTQSSGPARPNATKATWTERRAQRQAAKAARRAAKDNADNPATPAVAQYSSGRVPGSDTNAEPLLSATDRQALSRLTADNLARS